MANTYTNLLFHIVFSTKGRQPLIRSGMRDELYAYIGGIIRGERGTLLEIGGMPDHIHLLVRLKADVSVADMLRRIKSHSSKWANERPERNMRFQWQTGYSAFTVSESQAATVRRYIREQEPHHRGRSFREELTALLRKHGIEFEERFLDD